MQSEKQVLYDIYHDEDMYAWERINRNTLEEHLQVFLDALKEYNEERAEKERKRLNGKYNMNLT